MVRWPLPVAARLQHLVRVEVPAEPWRTPHTVEPAAAVVLGPVGRSIAPPGEAALRRGKEASPDVGPVVRLLKPGQRLHLDGRMADDGEQRLVAPDVALERGDVEIADD